MVDVQATLNSLVDTAQQTLNDVLEAVISTFWNTISSALSPLSPSGRIGLVLGFGALILVGIQSQRKGHEGRVEHATIFIGFLSLLLIIIDFLPQTVRNSLLAFVTIGALVVAYNMKSYFAGDTESTKWYDTYRLLFGSLTLATIVLALVLEYIVGLNLPVLP